MKVPLEFRPVGVQPEWALKPGKVYGELIDADKSVIAVCIFADDAKAIIDAVNSYHKLEI
jgi:hypothetical protein